MVEVFFWNFNAIESQKNFVLVYFVNFEVKN